MRAGWPTVVGRVGSAIGAVAIAATSYAQQQTPLTQLQFDIVGIRLTVDPPTLTVPKNIPTFINTSLEAPPGAGTNTAQAIANLANGALVEAELRGPSLTPTRIVARPGQPLQLPAFALPGNYFLDQIRLVKDGQVVMDAQPSAVPITVINEVFITGVTSRPLSLAEIQQRGIVIDEKNFQLIEFQIAFDVGGRTFRIDMPTALPTPSFLATGTQELVKLALLGINNQLAETVRLPPELDLPGLNFSIAPLPFFRVGQDEEDDRRFGPPPIAGLLVIPGNVGFLNQFFSAIVMVTNVAPAATPLVLRDVQATVTLPVGRDGVGGTYDTPGDDPLRLARIQGIGTQGTIAIVQAGPDGTPSTFDDVTFIAPQQSGEGEFLIEGLQEGGHTLDIEISAVLHGLPSGPVDLRGQTAGAVLVRNPNFSLTLAHPRTVRAGEPYSIYATITNTSRTMANLVSVNLDPRGVSGAQLVSDPTVLFQTLAAGQSATAQFRLVAQQTGSVNFSLVNTGTGLTGAFQLTTGIGERGIPLAPNAIVLPAPASALPGDLIYAAQRVLGQAFSIATAPVGTLPPEVLYVRRQTVIDRGVELGEAGQRVQLGEPLVRVVQDLLLDWMGNRRQDDGFDQLLRTTDAGAAFFAQIAAVLRPAAQASGVLTYQQNLARATVHREPHIVAITGSATGSAPVRMSIADSAGQRVGETIAGVSSALPYASIFGLSQAPGRSELGVVSRVLDTRYVLELLGDGSGTLDLGVVIPNGPGQVRQLQYPGVAVQAGSVARVVIDLASSQPPVLTIDLNGDGAVDSAVTPTVVSIVEEAPHVLAVRQLDQLFGTGPEDIRDYAIHGLIVAALFDKPVTTGSAEALANYSVDGNEVMSVKLQPSGRLAYLLLRKGIGTYVARSLTLRQIADERAHVMPTATLPIATVLAEGATVYGQVTTAIGDPVPNAIVTLAVCCVSDGEGGQTPITVSQVFTDIDGTFQFDYVTRFGLHFSLSAEHPITEEVASVQARVRGAGERILLNVTFIGRGTVRGRVLLEDGVTTVPRVPVIVTPNPAFQATDAQRQVRGVVTNDAGEFVVTDMPVGSYSITSSDTRGFFGQASGVLPLAGQTAVTDVILSVDPSHLGRLTGRVFNSDGATPLTGATVYVGRRGIDATVFQAVARAVTDASGSFAIDNLQESGEHPYDVVAVDTGTQQVGRVQAAVLPGRTNSTVIVMEASGSVEGIVRNAQGQVVAGALVAGGVALGVTDANGFFRIEGVPAGRRTITAGDPVTKRRGEASVTVLPAQTVSVQITLEARATITGRVFDAQGVPVPRATVRLPRSGGFIFVFANNQGFYRFPDLPLDDYLIQAPGPDQATLITYMRNNGIDPRSAFTMGDVPPELGGNQPPRTETEVLNAYAQALRTYLRLDDPLIVGPPPIPAGGFGWNRVRLLQDSITVNADLTYLPQGTASGRTLQANGIPTGAIVRLNSLFVRPNGSPGFGELERKNSDAQTGAFSFGGIARFDLLTFQAAGVRAGDFTLEAVTPFSPAIASFAGALNPNTLNMSDIELRFPAATETNGTVSGLVLMPDGVTPAPENTEVTISFGDLTVRTDAQGRFRSALPIPGGTFYQITARDPVSGLQGLAVAEVPAGGNVDVTIRLVGLGRAIVTARRPDGALLTNARVFLTRGQFPPVSFEGATNAAGQVTFVNVPEGPFSVVAEELGTGLTGRATATAIRNADVPVTVILAASGTVQGTFVRADAATPVAAAQIVLRTEGGVEAYAVSDANGRFELRAIPTGRFTVSGRDFVTGRQGQTTGELRFEGEVAQVTLIELASGSVVGLVLQANGVTRVPGATVQISSGPSFNQMTLQVSARTDGSFTFEGVPVGTFALSASDPDTLLKGTASGTLTFEGERVSTDVLLQPVGQIRVQILDSAGAPASNASVLLLPGSRTAATDTNGQFLFDLVELGTYTVRAHSLAAGREHDGGVATATVESADQLVNVTVRFAGVGEVAATVVASDGVTRIPSARVTLTAQGSAGEADTGPFGDTFVGFSDANGVARFLGVPVGAFSARAESGTLSGLGMGSISSPDEVVPVTVRLIPSATIRGRVLLPDGITPAAQTFVTLTFPPQSGLQSGRIQVTTDLTGTFSFAAIPLGPFTISAFERVSRGVRTASGTLSSDGQILELGDLVLDNVSPRIISMTPTPGATGTNPAAPIVLTFSEPMRPQSFVAANTALREGTVVVEGSFALSAGNTVLTFTPAAPLRSSTAYTMTVRGVPDGPEDTEGLRMLDAFVGSFIVADTIPPELVSTSPAFGARGVVPESSLRFTFSEPVASTFAMTVTGPTGTVAGSVAQALGGTVVVFAPTQYLSPNATYTATLAGIVDLVGNARAGGPVVLTFETVDTRAPTIAALSIVGTPSRIAGTSITVRPTIGDTDVARVEYSSADPVSQIALASPYDAQVRLPNGPATVDVIAVAVDQAGNRSSARVLAVAIEANAPPVATLTNQSGITRPAPGQTVTFQVQATDDVGLAELVFSASGALSVSAGSLVPDAQPQFARTFDVTIPPSATGTFTVQAAAVDTVGNRSAPSALQLEIGEATRPVATIVSLANGATVAAGTLEVTVSATDNVAVSSISLACVPAITGCETRSVTPPSASASTSFTIQIPANLAGTTLTLTATARDVSGNESLPGVVQVQVASTNTTGVLAQHLGSADPTTEGFSNVGGITSTGPIASDGGVAAWQVDATGCCGYFYHPVDYTSAFLQGWRLSARVRVVSGTGTAYVGLNPSTDRPRFDVTVATSGADAVVGLAQFAQSYTVPGGAGQYLLLQLVYDPRTSAATLFVDGVARLSGYTGWTQFLENRGLLFGADGATANFNLVRLALEPEVIDFEDQQDAIPFGTTFPADYRGVTWTNWRHHAPYAGNYQLNGANAVYAAADGATLTFPERVFLGARFSRLPDAPGDIYFELYRSGALVWTSEVLSDVPPQLTFLASGYSGVVDEVRVRSLGTTMTPGGSAWIMDDVTFATLGARVQPVITWPTPANIVYGVALGATQLNATANVPGSFVYTPPTGTVLGGGAHQLTVTFVPADALHYEQASATVGINVLRAPQAPLAVAGAPEFAGEGTSFTVSTTGGSGNGLVTFAATGNCTNVGAVVTMTSSLGSCSIVATKAGDANYLAATSPAAIVQATGGLALSPISTALPLNASTTLTVTLSATRSSALQVSLTSSDAGIVSVPATATVPAGSLTATFTATAHATAGSATITASAPGANSATAMVSVVDAQLEIVEATTALASAAPGTVTVRLRGSGAPIVVPSGGVALTTATSNAACVTAAISQLTEGSLATPATISYGTATLPCTATITITSALFGSDSVVVTVFQAEAAYSAATSISFYNPAPVPPPGGQAAARAGSVSYYNPAPIPAPGGVGVSGAASVSFYNPAPIPAPDGIGVTGAVSVSYYNPAPIPSPSGAGVSGVTSVSYSNPEGAQGAAQAAQPAAQTVPDREATGAVAFTVSVANGPVATAVSPARLSRGAGAYTLTIRGANLTGASTVTLIGFDDAIVSAPVVQSDGLVTVDVLVLPGAPLGMLDVVVGGAGWSTPRVPQMRIEIVQ